jgi:hypothetical protein
VIWTASATILSRVAKGRGETLASWKTKRHNEGLGHVYKLGIAAGKEIVKEASQPHSKKRPGDIMVANDSGGLHRRYKGRHSWEENFSHTYYDLTIAATQKLKNGAFGFLSAAGGAGAEADVAYKKKVNKYRSDMASQPMRDRRGRFEPLVLESSGLAHPGVRRLVSAWQLSAYMRTGSRQLPSLGCSTRRKISATIHYWNAVSIIRRAGSGLLLRASIPGSGFVV